MYNKVIKRLAGVLLSLTLLGFMVSPAGAETTFNMSAGETTLTMPDGAMVPAWGFALDSIVVDGETPIDGDGIVKVPGDVLVVPPGHTTVTIHLTNNLAEPVSLHILGQQLDPTVTGGVPQGPIWTAGLTDTVASTGSRISGDDSARVRSFAHETPAMVAGVPGTATYRWVNFRPGTFMLQSATNPAKQVQMGLYTAMTQDVAAGEAYPGVFYTKGLVLVYSEIDPEMHEAIAGGYYGSNPETPPPGKAVIPSSLHRDPKYFLINGMAFDPGSPDGGGLDPINSANPVNAGDTLLIRFLNAGYETHVPQLLNMYMKQVAEDGNPHTYARQRYGIQLSAGKIVDATIYMSSTLGRFSIHDAALHLTNNGAAAMGGMLAFVATPPCLGDIHPVGAPDMDVDGLDLFTLMQDLGQPGCSPAGTCPGDISPPGGDGAVDSLDLAALAEAFGRANCP